MKLQFHTRDLPWAISRLGEAAQDTDCYWLLSFDKRKAKRSLNQNDYYFGVIVKLFGDHTGYDKHESHQSLAGRFLSYVKNHNTFVKSTTELNTKEFEDYLEQCRVFMWHELNIHVPLPNEVTEEMWNQIS